MSKAFTKEIDEDEITRQGRSRQASGLPPGAQNYMTADGARRFREELDRLVLEERPQAKTAGTAALAEVNRRIAEVQQVLRSAEVVPAPTEALDEVRFGATVTVQDASGGQLRFRIVGVDEADVAHGCVSWLSTTAKALLGARLGQQVRIDGVDGEREMEVVGIGY